MPELVNVNAIEHVFFKIRLPRKAIVHIIQESFINPPRPGLSRDILKEYNRCLRKQKLPQNPNEPFGNT